MLENSMLWLAANYTKMATFRWSTENKLFWTLINLSKPWFRSSQLIVNDLQYFLCFSSQNCWHILGHTTLCSFATSAHFPCDFLTIRKIVSSYTAYAPTMHVIPDSIGLQEALTACNVHDRAKATTKIDLCFTFICL